MKGLTFLIAGLVLQIGYSQENIPLGTWRPHLSFNDLDHLASSPDFVYASNETGILQFQLSSQEITTISKINGLNSAALTAISFAETTNQLVAGHENGLITIINDNEIQEIDAIAISPALTGSRKINHLSIEGSTSYCSTDFGVVVLNLTTRQVNETYRDLSAVGETLVIHESKVLQDTLYLATDQGVLSGALNGSVNLLDFRNWKRYDTGVFNGSVQSITVFENKLFAVIDFQGMYRLDNGIWNTTGLLPGVDFHKINASSANLIICEGNQVWISDGVTASAITSANITDPEDVIEIATGDLWIADGSNGLIAYNGETTTSYKPNAPGSNSHWAVISSSNDIVSVKGGFSAGAIPQNRDSKVDFFINGLWDASTSTLSKDVVDYARFNSADYFASFGSGLEQLSNGNSIVFNPTNSPLSYNNDTDQWVLISTIENSNQGLWVVNYGSSTSLLQLLPDQSWKSYAVEQVLATYAIDLKVDFFNNLWMIIDPARGGGIVVFNPVTIESKYLTTLAGVGGLPSNIVRSIAIDRDGLVWVGTNEGVVYFSNPGSVLSANVDAIRPIYENSFLLRNERVTAIAVDGGNRKWMGTENGVWLFNPTGDELIYNFTEENSPLPSNQISSIAINPTTGEVFFATAGGLVSFRSDATTSQSTFSNVKIFPNPVDPTFAGLVSISGLYTDAIVKITDISGRLIWETRANGGTATWNARQLNGNRVSTGMYLVFATSEDGKERHVGKIAVIE